MRVQEESVATAKSRAIDLQIEADKLEAQKNRTPVRILLLGKPPSVFQFDRSPPMGMFLAGVVLKLRY